jgi:ligand-binding sensor domain-containing protein
MNTLINSTSILKSPFKVILSDKGEIAYKEAGQHAVVDAQDRLFIGTMTGTYNGNAFTATDCHAAGAWVSIHKIESANA